MDGMSMLLGPEASGPAALRVVARAGAASGRRRRRAPAYTPSGTSLLGAGWRVLNAYVPPSVGREVGMAAAGSCPCARRTCPLRWRETLRPRWKTILSRWPFRRTGWVDPLTGVPTCGAAASPRCIDWLLFNRAAARRLEWGPQSRSRRGPRNRPWGLRAVPVGAAPGFHAHRQVGFHPFGKSPRPGC